MNQNKIWSNSKAGSCHKDSPVKITDFKWISLGFFEVDNCRIIEADSIGFELMISN
jgi:hypothetical protein